MILLLENRYFTSPEPGRPAAGLQLGPNQRGFNVPSVTVSPVHLVVGGVFVE